MNRGQILTELRRSNAAGIHDHRPARSEERRRAIAMSYLDEDYLTDVEGPSLMDLADIENESGDDEDDGLDGLYDDGYDYDIYDRYDSEYDLY